MGLPRTKRMFTVDEYLELERGAEERHEYLDGQIRAMAGESGAHGDITQNISGLLYLQLLGKPCRARTKDTKVRSGPTPVTNRTTAGLYSCPDIVVICGEPDYHDACTDVILNPTVIIEVLSESTEQFDRGDKLKRYQTWNPSLQAYLLVAQDRPRIEIFIKNQSGEWTYELIEGLDAAVTIRKL